MIRYGVAAALITLATPALAQQQAQAPMSMQIMQNMVGQLAGQNAQLSEQLQTLANQNAELRRELDAAKKPAPDAPKDAPAK